jgi:hypothetical protein
MKWYVYSIVIGAVMFSYIKLFVRNMKIYKDSNYTMSWGQFIDNDTSPNQNG